MVSVFKGFAKTLLAMSCGVAGVAYVTKPTESNLKVSVVNSVAFKDKADVGLVLDQITSHNDYIFFKIATINLDENIKHKFIGAFNIWYGVKE